MTTLIEKLQAAEEGSPELSAEVCDELGVLTNKIFLTQLEQRFPTRRVIECDLPVTQSIDAALTIKPDGSKWSKSADGEIILWNPETYKPMGKGKHNIEAIAICIAVLSANKQREVK